MPLELDDREPPEDDPDAPAPAPTMLRAHTGLRNGITAAGIHANLAAPPALTQSGGDIPESPAATPSASPARTCFLMRARRSPGPGALGTNIAGVR